jgi:transposase InsO family protein
MKAVYEVAGITKQALHKHRVHRLKRDLKAHEFFEQADNIRVQHPVVGCRKMALDMVCKGWGRDKIEALLLCNGYRVCYPPNYHRTTDHRKEFNYANLIEGLELNNINQVVQADITYYRIRDKFYYLSFLIDVYSRRIVGFAASKTLHAEASIKALKRMTDLRGEGNLTDLIHHSDRGTQYIAKEYRRILKDNHITSSMCRTAWENAYTERVNRTIKEEYLDGWEIDSYSGLTKRLKEAIHHYNYKRSHSSLCRKSPVAFENQINSMSASERPKLTIYKHVEKENKTK